MIRTVMSACALALAATPALAKDARLVSRVYNSDEVVRIESKAGVQASIAFAEQEQIENVAIGDSNAWQVTPNKRANLLFVKPLTARARTNMTVVTDKRTYFFDLVAGPAANPLYVLRFTYPEEPGKKADAPPAVPALTTEESRVAGGELPSDPASLNFNWVRKGDAKIMPARVYDDGAAVYLAWAPGAPLPSIMMRDRTGAEGPVNYAVRDDTLVVDGVPGILILRLGRSSATLENKGREPKTSMIAANQQPATARTEPKE